VSARACAIDNGHRLALVNLALKRSPRSLRFKCGRQTPNYALNFAKAIKTLIAVKF